MKTLKAIDHLKFRFQNNKLTVGEKERDALNTIIRHYNASQKRNEGLYKLFIKIFMEDFIFKAGFRKLGAKQALKIVESKLMVPLDEYYQSCVDQSKFLKFSEELEKQGYKDIFDLPIDKRKEQGAYNESIIKQNEDRFSYMLNHGYEKDQLETFLRNSIHDIILKYKDLP